MKVLLVNDFGMILGGAEKYFFMLAEQLKNRGHQVNTVSSNHSRKEKFSTADFQIPESGHLFNIDALFNPRSYLQMKRLVLDLAPDVIHFHNVFYSLSPSVLFASKGVRTVLTLHDYFSICFGDKTLGIAKVCDLELSKCKHCRSNCGQAGFEGLRRKIARIGLSRVDKLIAPSQFLAKEYQRNGYESVVIEHPVEKVNVSSEELDSLAPKNLLVVSRLARQKGVDVAIRAFALVAKQDMSLTLNIVGEGEQRKLLEKLAKELDLEERIIFYGWCSGSQLAEVYREASVLIQPAVWPEVAGLSVFEAASWGIPSIVSDIGALSEAVSMNNGLAVEAGNPQALAQAIIELISNHHKYQCHSRAALEFAQSRAMKLHLDKLEEVYQQ